MPPRFHKGFNVLPMKILGIRVWCLGLTLIKREENRLIFNGKDEENRLIFNCHRRYITADNNTIGGGVHRL